MEVCAGHRCDGLCNSGDGVDGGMLICPHKIPLSMRFAVVLYQKTQILAAARQRRMSFSKTMYEFNGGCRSSAVSAVPLAGRIPPSHKATIVVYELILYLSTHMNYAITPRANSYLSLYEDLGTIPSPLVFSEIRCQSLVDPSHQLLRSRSQSGYDNQTVFHHLAQLLRVSSIVIPEERRIIVTHESAFLILRLLHVSLELDIVDVQLHHAIDTSRHLYLVCQHGA